MTIISVNSVTQLTSALSTAKSGDVIQLAAGTYSGVILSNINIAGNVTIKSADPLHQAVLTDLAVKGSSGLTFTGLNLNNPNAAVTDAFQVCKSSNIVLDHLKVQGPNNIGSGNEVSLMMVRDSSNVTVKDSDFSNGLHGLSLLNNTGVTIANNLFHNLRTDGIHGGGNSNISIAQNTFTNFYPAAGDHPDAIQLWTDNTTTSATNISITDNLVVRGSGSAIQGVFMRDISGTLPFKNVTITGNMFAGTMFNGISVDHVSGGTIANNTVAGYVGEPAYITATNSTGIALSNNAATAYSGVFQNAVGTSGNTLIQGSLDIGISQVSTWLGQHLGFSKHWAISDTAFMGTISLTSATLAAITAARAQYVTITGTANSETLCSSSKTNSVVDAGAGNDTISSSAYFNHTLKGGAGNDTYYVRSATATVVEALNEGIDTVRSYVDYTLTSNVENLVLLQADLQGNGNALNNQIAGSSGMDTIYGMDGNDILKGNDGNDYIWGGNGDDALRGDNGNDFLLGEMGNDNIMGGAGNDIIDGGAGNDLIIGGLGNDVMTGGAGMDNFFYYKTDVATFSTDEITDFTVGQDKINLAQLVTGTRFTFIDTQAFHKVVGELHYTVVNGSAMVEGDINGDGRADFAIKVDNVTTLSRNDFII